MICEHSKLYDCLTQLVQLFCLDWELNGKVKEAGVTDNLFTVVYTNLAIEKLGEAKPADAE